MASEDLDKLKGDRKLPRKILFKRKWQYVKKEWVSLLFAFLLVFVGVAIDIVFPLFMQHLTNTLQNPTDQTLKRQTCLPYYSHCLCPTWKYHH